MFSPATKKTNNQHRKANAGSSLLGKLSNSTVEDSCGSPITPLHESNVVPNRPSTGTPAPWASRLSVLARIPTTKSNEKGEELNPIRPVYVGEFPSVVRNEQQAMLQQKHSIGEGGVSGGMDRETFLAWIICRNKFFIWNYLSPTASRRCIVLDIPSSLLNKEDSTKSNFIANSWLICVLNWENFNSFTYKVGTQSSSTGVILCNKRSRTLLYWPDIYSEHISGPVISYASIGESRMDSSPGNSKSTSAHSRLRQRNKLGSSFTGSDSFNSLIASPVHGEQHSCVALACSSNGELWQFCCSSFEIQRKKLDNGLHSMAYQSSDNFHAVESKGYPRSLTWNFLHASDDSKRQFLLLTDREIQCWTIGLVPDCVVSKLWSHEIIGNDSDLGIQKDLAGQKRIWPLDLQVDNAEKVITILIAIFCKDRVTSSSYTEYSLLTMQYRSGIAVSAESFKPTGERVLEKKAPIQVIIPKARVEDEEFLFSMRFKIGGRPAGSVIILSGDGTATVSHYWRNLTRLYQFDLPNDAGKVLDASVFPSSDDGEDGAWAVITEKAGVWAIPERAVLLGGVEPPERSLSRKGSSKDRTSQEESKDFSFAGNFPPRRATSEVWDAGDRQRAPLTGIARRNAQDEESEVLLNQLFNDFLLSGEVDGTLDKLKKSGAFEREGETNVFARTSKSLVDTLAKHWTTTRGAEVLALSLVSTQLLEKQQKHQKFLQFLALSKCHEELCSRQREPLQIVLEHGEKLAGMIQIRELQSIIFQSHGKVAGSSYSSSEVQTSAALWDLIQLVGERARRKTVLLMDRDNFEVFYSRVSDIEELFCCLDKQLLHIIGGDMSSSVQIQRACELSNVCVNLFHTVIRYRDEHHLWYPPLEGLTPWYCQTVVRSGLWSIASFMLQLVNETYSLDNVSKLDFYSHLGELTDVLLESYSGAVTAKFERNEDHKSLSDDFSKRKDALLDSLYKQVKGLSLAKLDDSVEKKEEENKEILQRMYSTLLPIAKRHEGYQVLWSICCDLNDLELLKSLMHDSVGPTGGFSNFVFKQLYEKKQFSRLLRLGEEFSEELSIFLKQHQELLWLHEIFLNQFSLASENLHVLALSQDDAMVPVDNKPDYHDASNMTTLAQRKRFLHLSKIGAIAGKDANYVTKVKRIEADLNILKVQEEILKFLPDDEEKKQIERRLVSPVELIELCLKSGNRELALRAFDVFAWTSSSFIKCNSSLLEECWRNAANNDDWDRIYQLSSKEGWSEEETLRILGQTLLFLASRRCYGPEASTFEGSFDEVLPLRQDSSESSYAKDLVSSVEAILMQHKDFPDAGKLMLTAVMLGSDCEASLVDEASSPME